MIKELASAWNHTKLLDWLERFLPHRLPFLVLFQIVLMAAAYLSSFYLRFEGLIPREYYLVMWKTLPIFLLVQAVFFQYHDLFRGLWRYVAFSDLQNILRATLMSMLVLILIDFLISPYTGAIPRSIFVLNSLLVITYTGGCRLVVRHLRERYLPEGEHRRVMVVGKLKDAEPLLREMSSHMDDYLPVALVEPHSQSRGFRMYDVPIVGGIQHIARMVKKYRAQEIIFAWPDAPADQLNEILAECKRSQVRYRIVPSWSQVLDGQYRMADVRDIELEDLLPRPAIYIDQENINAFISDKVVLVTGGGGSIGSELCRQVAKFTPRSLIIFERAENSLYEIEVELKRRFPNLSLHPLVASINDGPGLDLLLQHYRPDLIFHAAAYKHVPLMERCPIEAAYNNILGTRNLVKAAIAAKVGRFVMISTDKAVNPTSVMGVSKRIAEKYVQACNGHQYTRFITTRFGNVLGSAGSLIPLLKSQLSQGGPLTITHPEIERFFMTIPEAVQLVLQAACIGKGGDIFVLNMGTPVKITDLAEKLILLAGKTPGKDIPINFIGLRPGEKLYEELFNDDEEAHPTEHPLIDCATGPNETLEKWEVRLNEIQELVRARDRENLLAFYQRNIHNYNPSVSAASERV
jgi:FlaA1/EpsC-like NDP-sugar epimerase